MRSKRDRTERFISLAQAKSEWWWFDPECHLELTEVAESWELLRRTEHYRSIWDIYRHGAFRVELEKQLAAIARGELNSEARGRVAQIRLLYMAEILECVGCQINSLLMANCDPAQPWSTLSDSQRTTIKSCSPLLPRQCSPGEDDANGMTLGIGEVTRKDHDIIVLKEKWAIFPVQTQLPRDFARLLRSGTQQTFIVLEFDLRLGRKALFQQLDKLLLIMLKVKQRSEEQQCHQDQTGNIDWTGISDSSSPIAGQ